MSRQKKTPDFSGWATKFGIKCTDGRTILKGAFADDEGKKVPIVYSHIHDDPDMILGHAYLYNKPEGVWAEGYFNNGSKAQSIKEALRNEDLDGLSIYANNLKHVNGREVAHGSIKELSVVLAGANMGATIQNVMLAHGDGLYDELEDEAIIYWDELPLCHAEETAKKTKKRPDPDEEEDDEDEDEESDSKEDEDEDEDKKDESEDDEEDDEDEDKEEEPEMKKPDNLRHADEEQKEDGKTIQDVWDSMTEEQKNVCYFMMAQAQEDGGEDDEDDEAAHNDDEGEELTMKTNAFDRTNPAPSEVLSHDDMKKIIERGVKLGSMKDAWNEALETNDTLSHAVYNDDGTEQKYGIANIDYLFPYSEPCCLQ